MSNDSNASKSKKFNQFKEEDLLLAESISDYNKAMKFFFSQLLHIETNLFIVGKIAKFPFGVFTTPDERIFFTQVYRTFLDDIILTLYKLVVDESGGFTIRKLRDQINNSIKSEYKEDFHESLQDIKFEKKTERLRKKIGTLRNQVVAHHSKDFALTGQHPVDLYFNDSPYAVQMYTSNTCATHTTLVGQPEVLEASRTHFVTPAHRAWP